MERQSRWHVRWWSLLHLQTHSNTRHCSTARSYAEIDGRGVLTFLPFPSLPSSPSSFPLPFLHFPWHPSPSLPFPRSLSLPYLFPSLPSLPFLSLSLPPLEVGPLKPARGAYMGRLMSIEFGALYRAVRKPLVAITSSILKCMFYSRSITI